MNLAAQLTATETDTDTRTASNVIQLRAGAHVAGPAEAHQPTGRHLRLVTGTPEAPESTDEVITRLIPTQAPHALPAQAVPDVDGQLMLRFPQPNSPITEPQLDRSLHLLLHQLSMATVEVFMGERSPSQISRWCSYGVATYLQGRGVSAQRHYSANRNKRSRVQKVIATRPTEHVCEVAVVFEGQGKFHAMALRFQDSPRGWRLAALEAKG